jgi:GT2 family glycosyltransferase
MVHVIIVNYNNFDDTLECLNSFKDSIIKEFKIYLINNSSDQKESEKLRKIKNLFDSKGVFINIKDIDNFRKFGKLNIIDGVKNRGFAAANNIALKLILDASSDDDLLWILNNDTTILKNTINHFTDYMSSNKIDICGTKLIYYNTSILQGVGGRLKNHFFTTKAVGSGLNKMVNLYKKIDFVIGASMIIRPRVFKDIGYLNEEYFLYYEEIDFCLRAKKNGYKIGYDNESFVYHKEGGSIGTKNNISERSDLSEFHLYRSRDIFVKKHYKRTLIYYITTFLLLLRLIFKGKKNVVKEIVKEII